MNEQIGRANVIAAIFIRMRCGFPGHLEPAGCAAGA